MKQNETILIRLDAPCFPPDIYVSLEHFNTDMTNIDADVIQNQSGRTLLRKMAEHFLGEDDIQIFTQKNEKPEAYYDKAEISVSFSHTKEMVSAAMSRSYNVGCDMENASRKVHPRLIDRMRNENESNDLYEKVDPVKIWTLKESVLKMIGTGLRKPMHGVEIQSISDQEFDVILDNGERARICSFQHKDYWISVSYQKLTEGQR